LPPQPPASVRFEVRSAGKDPDSKWVFLNSAKDHKKAGNFVVVLSPEVAVKFKAAGIRQAAAAGMAGSPVRVGAETGSVPPRGKRRQ
jgi:hypothetical protein